MNVAQLVGWIPIRLYWQQSQPLVDWCYLGRHRLTEPFFEQTIAGRMRHPFNLLFRHQTPIETLAEWQTLQPGLPPSGFIFHTSRCGSTLITQMLAVLPQNIVVSEAAPLDSILRANFRDSAITDGRRLAWLQWMVSALGQPRGGQEKHLFIKFDSWSIIELALIHQAFPGVPWIFVYRDPVEVLVSHLRRRGGHMLPGVIEPALFDLDEAAVFQMPAEEYCARVLAKICKVALHHQRSAAGMLVNYQQLPEVVSSALPNFFGLNYTAAELDRMAHVAQFDAKNPVMTFADDTASKNREATGTVRQMADRWVERLYEQLETARNAQRIV